jgi:hypothetical protein
VDGCIYRHLGAAGLQAKGVEGHQHLVGRQHPGPYKQFTCGWYAERGLAVLGLTGITDAHAQRLSMAANHETAASNADDIAKPHTKDIRC